MSYESAKLPPDMAVEGALFGVSAQLEYVRGLRDIARARRILDIARHNLVQAQLAHTSHSSMPPLGSVNGCMYCCKTATCSAGIITHCG